jgi:hypothetical protein
MKKLLFIFLIPIFIFAVEIDPATGLVKDVGLSDVKENCTICHTGRFIVINGGNKNFWKKKIKLMHDAYGLWELSSKQKELIVNYLAKYYSKKKNISINQ